MKNSVAVVGAAAIGDYLFYVSKLPEKGDIAAITDRRAELIPGGCAPNIATGIAAMKQLVPILFYPVGNDFAATGFQELWRRRGIDCSGLTLVSDRQSGCAWMFIQEDGSTMCFGLQGAAEAAIADVPELPEWVIIAPVLNRYTNKFLDKAIQQHKRVIITGICVREILPYLNQIYALILSKRESVVLLQELGLSHCNEIAALYPNLLLFVTDGKAGSSLYKDQKRIVIPVVQAEILTDVTGAGDAYTAGVISGLASGMEAEKAGLFGAGLASYVVEQMGGQCEMPTWEQVMARISKIE